MNKTLVLSVLIVVLLSVFANASPHVCILNQPQKKINNNM